MRLLGKKRLYPKQDGSLYVLVCVHESIEYMLEPQDRDQNVQGYFVPLSRYRIYHIGYRRKLPQFGTIHFGKKWLDPEVLTHEVFHAAVSWAHRMNVDMSHMGKFDPPDGRVGEEDVAYAVGFMTYQLVNWLIEKDYFEDA